MTMLSVVIPAYNEENGIEEIARRVLAIKPALAEVGVNELELIVVDDGSKDRTGEIASSIEGVRLIRQANKGYGGALKTGFVQANGELIGFLDADGTYPPEYFPQLCIEALKGADLVIGSRRAGEKSQMPLTRRIGNFFFANLLSLISRQKVTDSASGQRVFKAEMLERMLPLPNGLNLTPVQSARALHEEMKVIEVPIPYSERLGRSKLSVVHDGRIFLQSILWTVMMYNPVRILGLIGAAVEIYAIAIFLGLIIARLRGITSINPLGVAALFSAVVAANAGINLYALGVTFNQLVALFTPRPIKQGMFGGLIFRSTPWHHFSWMGMLAMLLGLLIGIISLLANIGGENIARLWLYLLSSAMFFLVGLQMFIYWMLLRILDDLTQREELTKQDLTK